MTTKLAATSTLLTFLIAINPGIGSAQEVNFEDGFYSTGRLTSSIDIGSGRRIQIQSARTLEGMLIISTAEGNQMSVDYVKKSKTTDADRAVDYIDLIDVVLDKTAQGGRLQLRAPNPVPWSELESGSIDLVLKVPADCLIDVDAAYFDITASGPFEEFIVPSSMGRMKISDVTRRLDLVTVNRRVSIERIAGRISVATTNSTLMATDIDNLNGPARFRNEGGDIQINRFEGGLNIKNSYGRIEIEEFSPRGKKNFIRCHAGPILLRFANLGEAQIRITNRFEDIEMTLPSDLSSVLSLAVEEGGRITATGFPFVADLVEIDRLDLVAGDGTASVSASVSGKGNIYIRGYEGGR